MDPAEDQLPPHHGTSCLAEDLGGSLGSMEMFSPSIVYIYIYTWYESKPWYPSEPQITGKWMFIPPNIARLVLIHPHINIVLPKD